MKAVKPQQSNFSTQQVKSKQRVADHGEVFTAEREVNAMLDLVKQETERIESRFLEPACGNGNFLIEILRRKLTVVTDRYKNNQFDWERYALLAVSSIYGVEILEDNAQECRERLFQYFESQYTHLFKQQTQEAFRKSIRILLKRNIIWGDALDFTNPETRKPIIFSEWSFINETQVKRRDFVFRFLVEKSHQFSLFDEDGEVASIDEPIQDFPLIHFLKLGANEIE